MKKFLLWLMVAALLLAAGVQTFAEETVKTPWNDSSMKIAVVEDFSDLSSITGGYLGIEDTAIDVDELADYAENLDGAMYFGYEALGQVWVGIVDKKFVGADHNAEGFGFYVRNEYGDEVNFCLNLSTNPQGNLNGGAYCVGSEKEYVLIDKDGTQTVMTAPVTEHEYFPGMKLYSYYTVPADFEGWICVPLENL